MTDFEKLGAFYLGKVFDPKQDTTKEELLLYDSKDLTTHAVCVGMTGSGKTGLCLSLLEEAAIDGIPTIAIDPKGDLGNLMLSFPKLDADSFEPWIDPGEASRKGQSVREYASDRAQLWKKGLSSWGQDGKRIKRFKDAVDLSIYTPGSNAGLPITVLRSFEAPPQAVLNDLDAFRDRVASTASGLLTLLGIEADPIRSREHILLSNIMDKAWRESRTLDLPSLIREIQSPPFQRIGVMDLDAFYPAKDRFELAMNLNNLLASPTFGAWLEGEPLDVQRLLWTPEGKPRISIISIAHLSEAERMFIVTLLLNECITWMRTQSGTGSLRALLYMDEVFGYFPPTANPPSKTPMLTLLKQARAYGLGCVLATQNPVDLDYKGLSNTGTWFLGRLQTEQDKMRVLDGLEGASASAGGSFNRKEMEATLSGLKSRVFLMNNVHDNAPELFHTRWALSYLRGPLTQTQIRTLMAPKKQSQEQTPTTPSPSPTASHSAPIPVQTTNTTHASVPQDAAGPQTAPTVAEGVEQWFLTTSSHLPAGSKGLYRPMLYAMLRVHWVQTRLKLDHWEELHYLVPLESDVGADPWDGYDPLTQAPHLSTQPMANIMWAAVPDEVRKKTAFSRWEKSLKSYAYRTQPKSVYECKSLKAASSFGESEGDFKVELKQKVHERRDLQLEKLKKKYTPKLERLQERERKALAKIDVQTSQYKQQKLKTAISVGATVLGAIFGRKVTSAGNVGRAGTAVRTAGRASQERDDIARAQADLEAIQEKLKALQAQFDEDAAEIKDAADVDLLEISELVINPRKSDLQISKLGLVWAPYQIDANGIATPLT